MSQRRVVITGMGWVTPLGSGLEEVWQRLLRADCGIGPITRYDASSFATNFAAEVKNFDLSRYVPTTPRLAKAGLNSQFALAAASMAWQQAGLTKGAFEPSRMGIYMGAGEGPMDFDTFAYVNIAGWDATKRAVNDGEWEKAALSRLDPINELEQEPHQVLSHMARQFGCMGPSFNCMTACAASTQAIGEAFEIIRRGDADLMFAGGSHSMIHPLGMTGFIRLTAMSTRRDDPAHASRPFDVSRDGFVMGEGAGVLVLESLESAKARGATPLAEIAGFGSSADAFRITDIQPDGKGAIAAMSQACRQAGIDPREPGENGRPRVHYISAHGTGTQENDKIETVAVKGVFGNLAKQVPFSSVKSMLGHLIQAAGAVELMTCVMAIQSGWVPPTLNLHTPDPECDLDYVPNSARDLRPLGGVDVCLSNSFGFGGQNNTLCVRRFR
ncbi:MAG TPA: beta-ketoacyl-[acyl-carrier-protein] synthase family protein [Phycisphaerales bacterium]|nr:beta-ketoacyl-[acyl-carrier-protein] synthase family protein [Phycisphaerales bacterium]